MLSICTAASRERDRHTQSQIDREKEIDRERETDRERESDRQAERDIKQGER